LHVLSKGFSAAGLNGSSAKDVLNYIMLTSPSLGNFVAIGDFGVDGSLRIQATINWLVEHNLSIF
jgi:hypothetical protein